MSPTRARRRIGAYLLLAGAVLAFTASFLPWVRITYQGAPDANAIQQSPGQNLLLSLDLYRHGTPFDPISLLGEVLFTWGVSLAVAVLAVAVLLERHPPTRSARFISLFLAVLGIATTLLAAYLSAYFVLDISERSPIYVGPGVALLGYLCALVAAFLLPAAPQAAQG